MAVNGQNGHTIYQLVSLQDTPKITQIGIFGLKIYHLATLLLTCAVAERCASRAIVYTLQSRSSSKILGDQFHRKKKILNY
jgi:hypothetical protein